MNTARRRLLTASLLIGAGGLPLACLAQTSAGPAAPAPAWPSRPVRLLVGFPPGSTPDLAARTIAEPLATALGQSVVVENRPGASGNIAADLVAKATDGHTLGVVINGNLTSSKILYPKLPYDPLSDFSYLSLIATAPLVLVAAKDLPTGEAFFAEARKAGDRWSYGSVGNGSVGHLGIEWLKSRVSGLGAVHVPYQGNPQVLTDLIGGQIQFGLVPPGLALPQVRAGKIQAIGLTSGRSALAPDQPSLADLGVRDFNLEVWTALVGPARLPAAAQRRIVDAVTSSLRENAVRRRLFEQGWQAVGSSPEGLQRRVEDEARILSRIIRSRGITLN